MPSSYIKKYKNGNQIGYLVETQHEVGLKFRYVLALLDDNGKWLSNVYWRSNATKKAHNEILSFGYGEIK